jgi:large conductance mechanosensitive channel
MSMKEEFKKFVLRGNVVDLAIAVIIGAAFGKIVTAFVDDLVMPVVSVLLPGGAWRELTVTPLDIKIGHLLGTILDFLIVAVVIFLVLVKFLGAVTKRGEVPEPTPPATKVCLECLETVPAGARRCKFCTSALVMVAILLLGAPAFAQSAPKFEYAQREDVKEVTWKSQVNGGMLMAGGNSRALTGNIGGMLSRKAGQDLFGIDANLAYGESNNLVFNPAAGGDPALVDDQADIGREDVVSTDLWNVRGRYDRFFTDNDSAYALVGLGRDRIAGKRIWGRGQFGYSRGLFKDDAHTLLGEIGYDFSYEDYVAKDAEGVTIHSARVFLGETWKVSDATGVHGNVEALFNLNKESDALDASVSYPQAAIPGSMPPMFPPARVGVGIGKDTRVNAKVGLTTALTESLSFGFGFTLRYDQNPAPLAAKPAYGPNFRAFADPVDFLVEASLIISLI